MLKEIRLPQLGQTMEEGTVERWLKQEGDQVKKGEVLYELTTDKATLEVESFVEGILLKILAPAGQTVPVNELVGVVGEKGDKLPEDLEAYKGKGTAIATAKAAEPPAEPAAAGDVPAGPSAPAQAAAPSGRLLASPRARKIAREEGIPLSVLRGSGPGGRIVERDVREYVEKLSTRRYTPAAREAALAAGVDLLSAEPAAPGERITKADVERAGTAPARALSSNRIPLSPMRRTIARRMTETKQTVPHFYLVGDVRLRRAQARREELNSGGGTKITLTHLLIRAAALALKKNPAVNARFEGDAIAFNPAINVGVAVAVEDGLFVPVVKNADAKPLSRIAGEFTELVKLAREGKLRPDQYEGGSLTLSNLGMYGVDYFLPIINPPEACILGIGKAAKQVVAEDGAIRVEPVIKVTLAADHRVVNGAEAAQYFATFRELVEDPAGL